MHIRPTHHVEMSELGSGRPVVNPQHLRACVTPEAGEGRHLRAKHQEGPSPSNPKCLQTLNTPGVQEAQRSLPGGERLSLLRY